MRKYLAPAVVAIYLTISVFAWAWLPLDVVFERFSLLKELHFQIPAEPGKLYLLKIAFYAMIGGGLGGVSFGMMNLQRHTTGDSFKLPFIGDYIYPPQLPQTAKKR